MDTGRRILLVPCDEDYGIYGDTVAVATCISNLFLRDHFQATISVARSAKFGTLFWPLSRYEFFLG